MSRDARIKAALADQWKRPDVPEVVLHLPYPTSVNNLYRRTARGVYKSPAYGTWFRAAGTMLDAQHPGKVSGPYHLTVALCRPDRKRRDLDNTVKSISDLLVHHRVVDDDSEAVTVLLQWDLGIIEGAHVLVRSAASGVARRVAA